MCGLIGHLGDKTNPVNLDKFNILGILNEERGEHSCGVTMDGEILKGIESLKLYRDFVAFYALIPPSYTTGMIGHTRKATFGIHSEANAHPFGFGGLELSDKKDPIYAFVGVHNGTLLNHTALANTGDIPLTKEIEEEYEIEVEGKKVKKSRTMTVSKIDSEILLERLFTDKNYKVLSEYNGAAALIWQDLSKPNTMFFYHGKSAKSDYDKEESEERPLYYWRENKNSIYVSSILDSLYVIGGNEKTIGEFKHNVVYEVKNGDIAKAKQTTINRSKNFKAKGYAPSTNTRTAGFGGGYCGYDEDYTDNFHGATARNVQNRQWAHKASNAYRVSGVSPRMGSSSQLQLNLEIPVDKGLLAEKFDFDPNLSNGLTMCKQLRYWRNGHLANGIYLFIKDEGFYHLGFIQKSCLEMIKDKAGKFWYNGDFHDEKPKDSRIEFSQPIDVKKGTRNANSYLHYMYEGVRVKTYSDWLATTDAHNKIGRTKFDIVGLSIASCHPIIDLESDVDKRIAGAYYGGTLADTTFTFLGSYKLYRFVAGQIKDISYIPGFEPMGFNTVEAEIKTLDRAAAFLEKSLRVNGYTKLEEKDLLRELVSLDKVIESIKKVGDTKIKRISDEVETRIDNILLTHFSEASEDYEEVLNKLSNYKTASTKAALACDIITKLIQLNE